MDDNTSEETGYHPKATGRCSYELAQLAKFAKLCDTGLRTVAAAPGMYEAQKNVIAYLTPGREVEFDELIQQSKPLAETAAPHIDNGFTYFYQLATTKLWTLLETMVDGVVKESLYDFKLARLAPALGTVRGDVLPYLVSDSDELRLLVFSAIKEATRAKLKEGITRFTALLESVGISGPIDQTLRDTLYELSSVRNAIVHANGEADAKFVQRCPGWGLKVGEPIAPTRDHFFKWWSASLAFVFEVATWELKATGRHGLRAHPSSFRDDALANVRRLAKKDLNRPARE